MLTDRLSKFFGSGVRMRGAGYFYGGAVRVSSSDDSFIYARVSGTRKYEVCIDIDRSDGLWNVRASCTCPHADEGYGDNCKHIWATLLEMDSRHSSETPPSTVRFELVNDDDGDAMDDEGFAVEPDPQSTPRRQDYREREAPPAWAKLLGDLAAKSYDYPHTEARRLPDAAIEPIYVLEANPSGRPRGFFLSLAQQKMTAAGKLGKVKKLSLRPTNIAQLQDAVDREICLMLIGADPSEYGSGSYGYYSPYSYRQAASRFSVPQEVLDTLLPLLFATGRFRFRDKPNADPTPLAWDDGPPWELVLSIDRPEKEQDYSMGLSLRREDQRRIIHEDDHFFDGDPALLVRDTTMSRVEAHDCMRWLDAFSGRGSVSLGISDRDALLDQMSRLDHIPPVEWPAEWNITQVADVVPQPELALAFDETATSHSRMFASAAVRFRYGDITLDGTNRRSVVLDARANCQIHRDAAAERERVRRLMTLGVEADPYTENLRVAIRTIPPLVQTLLQEGWSVLGNDKLFRNSGSFSANVTTGIDWFELDSQVDFDGQTATLPQLLEAVQKGERYVRLGDGSVGMLPEKWLDKYGALLQMGRVEEGKVRFAKTQIGLIDALLAQMPEATFDRNFATARKKLQDFDGIKSRKAPHAFRGALRGYQEQGLAWLHFLRDFGWGGCLADDMGLGKTVQALAALTRQKTGKDRQPSLLVMPKSIIFNWAREAERFAPKLRVLDYTGTDRKQRRDEIDTSDLVLTTYGTMKRDIAFLSEREFQYVILDEAQAIKNPGSQNAKASRLLKAQHRLVMTGTPVENHLGDLWSLFEFLNPGMLGSSRAFKNAFNTNGTQNDSPEQLTVLQRMLRPFILRRTKEQVAKELPKRSEQTIDCTMGTRQAAYYKETRDYYRASLLGRVEEMGLAKSKVYVLEALLRLRQIACHPGLVDASKVTEESAKIESLLPMITELIGEGHKALVFSQFTKLLAIVRTRLDDLGIRYEYLDGRTRKRDQRVDHFQTDPDCPLFLISLKAGGVGLHLTAADYVFILDPWWNPAVEAQAIDRTHRIGQTRKVIAYRLIARDTVESKILELQQSKRDLAGAIINQSNSLIQDLTRDDLNILLS